MAGLGDMLPQPPWEGPPIPRDIYVPGEIKELGRTLRSEREARRGTLQLFDYLFSKKGLGAKEAFKIMREALDTVEKDVIEYMEEKGPPPGY